jgi:photosystem II stability/assembly factor-like uncharacterized protein
MPIRSPWLCLLAAGLVWGGAAREAAAHGRFPAAGSVAEDPSNRQRIWVRATYGILVTDNGGERWSWVCPEAVGFDANREDPAVVISGDGSIIAGTFEGLTVSPDGCRWLAAGGELADRFFVDVQMEADPAALVSLSSNGIAADTFEVNLWSTADNGASWAHLGAAPPVDFLALTMGVSAANPDRIYLSGRDGMSGAYSAVLQRSDDRGMTWTRVTLPEGDSADGSVIAYMGGVHPGDADRAYVGLATTVEQAITRFVLLATADAGATWTNVYERPHGVAGFALSPDGNYVAIGSETDGLWTASSDTLMFEKTSDVHVRCLTWAAGGLYACTDEFKDGYSLGVSQDRGQTFEQIMHLSSPCGPLDCPADSEVGSECPARWPAEQAELGAKDCDAAAAAAAARAAAV